MKSSAEKFLVFAGASALAGAAFALTGTALVVRSWSQSPATTVRAADFAWGARTLHVAPVEASVEQASIATFDRLDVSPLAIPNLRADIRFAQSQIQSQRLARRQAARVVRTEIAQLEKLAQANFLAATGSLRVQDELSTAQAQSVTDSGFASDQEMGAMLLAYRTLNSEFQAKLLLPILPTQEETPISPVAQAVATQKEVVVRKSAQVSRRLHKAKEASQILTAITLRQEVPRLAVRAALNTQQIESKVNEVKVAPVITAPAPTQINHWQASLDRAGSQLAQVDQAWNLLLPLKKAEPIRDSHPEVQVTPVVMAPVPALAQAETPVVTTQSAPTQSTATAYSSITPVKLPARAEYPMPTLNPASGLNSQAPAASGASKPASDAQSEEKKEAPLPAVATVASRNPKPLHVEAFEPNQAVLNVVTEEITHEGKSSWHLNSKHGYWPTLTRGERKNVPMISDANLKLMGWAAASPILAEAGVVFGRVPAGWEVSFSGRAETPLYLSMRDRRWLSGGTSTEDRYFVFLNAAPGAHLLHIQAKDGSGSGAVVVPVLSGVATNIQVTDPRVRKLVGSVLDAGDAVAAGLAGVRVRVLGNALAEGVMSGKRGAFAVPAVVTISGHPVWVETDSADGFTHRYQVSGDNLESAALFRMSSAQIQGWIGQLEGGVSPESGLIIAAVPGELAAAPTPGPFHPMIRILGGDSTLKPETYTISSDGRLEVDKALEPASPRFLGAQIPEGAVVAEFGTPDHSATWSQIQVTSPRVINVLGGL